MLMFSRRSVEKMYTR